MSVKFLEVREKVGEVLFEGTNLRKMSDEFANVPFLETVLFSLKFPQFCAHLSTKTNPPHKIHHRIQVGFGG